MVYISWVSFGRSFKLFSGGFWLSFGVSLSRCRVQESIRPLHSVFALINSHFKCAFEVLCRFFFAGFTSLRNTVCLLLSSHCRNVPFVEAITTDVYCLKDAPFTEICISDENERTNTERPISGGNTDERIFNWFYFFSGTSFFRTSFCLRSLNSSWWCFFRRQLCPLLFLYQT